MLNSSSSAQTKFFSYISSLSAPRSETMVGQPVTHASMPSLSDDELAGEIDDAHAVLRRETGRFEPRAAWRLAQHLPAGTPVFLASSMPVRDAEYFWPANDRGLVPYYNRGANGIDGTLSTALGVALDVARLSAGFPRVFRCFPGRFGPDSH